MEGYDEVGTVVHRTEFPNFAIETTRLRSYLEWPKSMKQKPGQLADAGLFYTKIGDRVVCFSCGIGLRAWDDDDDPWEQHALYSKNCGYLRLLKGQNYEEEVKKKFADKTKTSTNTTVPLPTIEQPLNQDDSEKFCEKWDEKLTESRVCKICCENEYNCVFIPCGHIIACAKCASALKECPTCRKPHQDIIRVYFP